MALGIITLFFLISFSLLYINKGLTEKPEFISKAVHKIEDNIDMLSVWGFIYSVVAIVLVPLTARGGMPLLIGLLANVMLFLLILPLMLDRLLVKYDGKIPAPIVTEFKNIVGVVTKNEKVAGYAGAGLSFLLFVFLF